MSTERIRGLTEAYNKIIGESLKENLNEEGGQPTTSSQANPQFGRKFLNRPPSQYLDAVKTLKGTKTLPAPQQQPVQQPSVQSAPQTSVADPKSEIDGLKNQIQILKLKQQVDALKKPVGTKPVKEDAEKGTKTLAAPAQQAPVKPRSYGKPWSRSRADLLKDQQNPNKDHTGYPNQTTQNEDVFDIVKNELIEEGHSEEEALSLMTSWTPEEINELRGIIENILTPSSSADDVESKYNKLFDAQRKKTSQYGEPWKRPTSPSDSESNIVPKKPGLHRGEEPTRPPKSPGGSVNRPVSRPEPNRPVSRPPELKRPSPKRW